MDLRGAFLKPDPTKYDNLSPDQKEIFDEYRKGNNIFITGAGGCGKSHLIRTIVDDAERIMKKKVAVTALTGCAALLLGQGATTIHRWAGIGLGKGDEYTLIERVKSNRIKRKKWTETQLLIIDEVSMMSQALFELLDMIGKHVRRSNRSVIKQFGKIVETKPYGGIQLIFCGDFYQLPPIGSAGNPLSKNFCFESELWDDTFDVQMILDKSFRQKDELFLNILNEIRNNELSKHSIYKLKQRLLENCADSMPSDVKPVSILPTKAQVNKINTFEMLQLGDEVETHHYYFQEVMDVDYVRGLYDKDELDLIEFRTTINKKNESDVINEFKRLKTNTIYDDTLTLKVGAQVMCIFNLDLENGVCNGSTGIIKEFICHRNYFDTILSKKSISEKINIHNSENRDVYMPVVEFSNGYRMIIKPQHITSDQIIGAVLFQIPLILAWGITTHKSQGATLDTALINIGSRVFSAGQAYVAMSRVRSLDGLYLTGFSEKAIMTDPRVVAFYKRFYEVDEDEEEEEE
jgi:ATP-dependent DNA helicase PIF1